MIPDWLAIFAVVFSIVVVLIGWVWTTAKWKQKTHDNDELAAQERSDLKQQIADSRREFKEQIEKLEKSFLDQIEGVRQILGNGAFRGLRQEIEDMKITCARNHPKSVKSRR